MKLQDTMKLLGAILILSLLIVVTGCQSQPNTTPNTPVGQASVTVNTPVPAVVQTQTPDTNTPDQAIDTNITVGNNPDAGQISAPDVDTSALA
jgi:uncharacterized lipoprotein YajG